MGTREQQGQTLPSDEPTATAAPPVVVPPRARGVALGRFIVLDELGSGATGTVYSAFDPVLDRRVAIKLLHTRNKGEDDSARVGRVEREAQAMARIKHPNVVTIYDVGVADDGSVFLAMEKIDGGTLHAFLKTKRPWRRVLELFCEAGDGLVAAHRAGVIHRDFKLDNVLMDDEGHPRVTDFGLARASSGRDDRPVLVSGVLGTNGERLSVSEPLTISGGIIGTPGYMPPEQYGIAPIDERADIFAFCAALYRGLYGERPFAGTTVEEIAESTLHGRVRDVPKGTDVPEWVHRAILRGLAAEKESRPASMADMLALLRDDPSRWARRIATTLGAVAMVSAGVFAVHHTTRARERACDAAADRLGGVWDGARKTQVAAAFTATDRTFAATALEQVDRTLDAYAARWTATARDACVATRIRGEQSEGMLDLRTVCLDDRLGELRALTDVLATADGKVVETASKAARELTPLDGCSDVNRLTAEVRLPKTPAARAEIRALSDDVARAKELYESGRRVPSKELLLSIRERVERTGYGPLIVSHRGRTAAAEKHGDEKVAAADYERAIELAEQYHLDHEKAVLEVSLGSFEGSWMGHTEEAHMWMRMADSAIARIGGDETLQAERDEEEAWVYQYEHKASEAEPLFRRVANHAWKQDDDEPDRIASAHSGLAEVLSAQGRPEEAIVEERAALRTMEDAYGRDHPWIQPYLNNLAMTEMGGGKIDEAVEIATRACNMLAAQVARGDTDPHGSDYGIALHTLGETLLRAHRFDDAATELTHAREIYRTAHGDENADVAYADYELAAAFRGLGRMADAQRVVDEARAIEAKVSDTPAAVVAGTFAIRARLDLDRNDTRAAIDDAEQALAALHDGEGAAAELADARLVVAKALVARGSAPDRARSLAGLSRDVFERVHDDERRDEAKALLDALH